MDEQHLLFYYLAGVPLLGITAQWLAWRFRLPSILLLLAFGVTLGWFLPREKLMAQLSNELLSPIVSLSVAIILFEGGLTLRWGELKEAGHVVFRLVTVGAMISWGLTAAAVGWLLGLEVRMAALIGALLVVTGPTVVAPLLRHIRPSRRIGSIVKWEGIVIDPVGAVLAVLVFEQVFAEGGHASFGTAAWSLLKTILYGSLLALAASQLLIQLMKRYLVPDFLHGVFFLAVALATFAVSNALQHESGLLAVTVLGIILANQKSISISHVIEFKEHLGVFLISSLFIVLGSRLVPRDLLDIGWQGIAFLAILILVIRPISVFVSTLRTEITWRERVFLSFLAPRGIVAAAVASVFALDPVFLKAGGELAAQASKLVPITFLVIVGTVSVYGLLAAPLARWLNLSDSNPQGILFAGADVWIRDIAKAIQDGGFQVLLVDTNYRHVAEARMAGLPAECSSILSEHVREESDLGGIGRMLAMTPNDEVNAMAAREFSHLFGRVNVYQVSPWDSGSGKRQSISEHLRGRLLFDEDRHHDELVRLADRGFQVKTTNLTEEFNYQQFQQRYGGSSLPLFLIDGSSKLTVCTAESQATPQPGQTLIALIDPSQEAKPAPKTDTDQPPS